MQSDSFDEIYIIPDKKRYRRDIKEAFQGTPEGKMKIMPALNQNIHVLSYFFKPAKSNNNFQKPEFFKSRKASLSVNLKERHIYLHT